MKTISIKLRLWGTMAFMAILLVALGATGMSALRSANDALRDVYTVQMASAVDIQQSITFTLRARTALDRVVMRPDAPEASANVQRAEGFSVKAAAAWKAYLDLPADAEERKLADDVETQRGAYLREGERPLIEALKGGKHEDAERVMHEKMAPLFTAYSNAADKLVQFQSDLAARTFEARQQQYDKLMVGAAVALTVALLAVVLSAVLLVRAILRPIQTAQHHFAAISGGDLTTRIDVGPDNEMGQLLRSLASMQTSLNGTVRKVREGSVAIATASREIAAGNADLSSRTEEQASALEETASSMEQITSSVRQNAEHARNANSLASAAADAAGDGGTAVGEVARIMHEIHAASRRIADITSVIDGIAFQTNILALNAAVEAARAGEQGRGFAVVASEVRNLAQRAGAAAKEIRVLIDDSLATVDQGTTLVDKACTTMNGVVTHGQEVKTLMSSITDATREQGAGIEQIGAAVIQMDRATQQNAALVEEGAAAAASLSELAGQLETLVNAFRLSDGGGAAPRQAASYLALPQA
ncbi:HAMP domain-containing protein [Oxalobacteraceae bacterium OM1]|nr:HAMP domain-containing protein [Oxalobacteraceae bacterium OM1]